MTNNFDRVVAALETIPGLTVIETSEESTLDDYPLPAATVDFGRASMTGLDEANDSYTENSTIEVVLHVAKTEPRATQRANMKALFKSAMAALISEFDEVTIENGYAQHVPFARGEAWSFGFEVLVGDQEYEL